MRGPFKSRTGFDPATIAGDGGLRKPQQGSAGHDWRCAMGVKGLDRLQPPRLSLLAFLFGPDDRLPVRRQNEPGAGVGDFDAVAAGLVDIEEEGLLDRVLVRAGLD